MPPHRTLIFQGYVFVSPSTRFTPPISSLLFPGQALQQSPDTVVREGDSVTLNCSQKGSTFSYMYWYKVPTGKDATLQLVVYSVEGGRADIEKEFRNHFQSNGAKGYRLSVEIDYTLLNDSGTYFCAKADCTVTQSLEQLITNLSMQRGISPQHTRSTVLSSRPCCPLAGIQCPPGTAHTAVS
uniref:Ig-like domain-containing protein n=1 Tax=Calidris pygmaea TaxID=425635 RepID=A0A8C3K3H6_9CHAR